MSSYVAFGLGIRSNLDLPELMAGESTDPDVEIELGAVEGSTSPKSNGGIDLRARPGEVFLGWPGVGKLTIHDGKRIVVDPETGADEAMVRRFVVGPALAVLLVQRGVLVLHASAVSIAGRAVAFLGGAGHGKSTMAAAMYEHGHPIVSDDVVPVLRDGDSCVTVPGFPQLKLWQEEPRGGGDKRYEERARGFGERPLELQRIFVLGYGDEPASELLHPRDAIVELLRHTWCARSMHDLTARSNLAQSTSVAAAVPIHRLLRPRALEHLPALVRIVEEEVRG